MDAINPHFPKKQAVSAVFAVTLGNLLEWYEIYLYVYWAPIISQLFFNNDSLTNLTYTFFIFAVGFLARPIGGFVFGRIGDRIGRRKTLILSVMLMIVPTCITGLLPTYESIGIFAPLSLGIMRFLQSFPAGGEMPGAFCYLYESAPKNNRRFLSSFAMLGPQLGILISTAECLFLEKYLSHEHLIRWGWRISFLAGGLIGFAGLCLRYRLHETPLFKEMQSHTHISRAPITDVLDNYKMSIGKAILFCIFNSSTFYLISITFPIYFNNILPLNYQDNLLLNMFFLILMTIPLPFFGKMGDLYNNKTLLLSGIGGSVFLLIPLFLSLQYASFFSLVLMMVVFCLFYTITSSLIPYIVADLFPTRDRFTGSSISFNLADAIIGGFTPFLAFYLIHATQNVASCLWIVLGTSLLSALSYCYLKPRRG